ncbi:hypothetical protein [Paenibacillus sanguinis]|uniref:hypothetical protein n=1 Tax=Paenibacillus sanguinis TaxID=225906 RepID=UPI00036E3D02|nr:hypothetical protein [Paenibacillus sanguinis]
MENPEVDYKQQIINLSNQVSSVSSTVSSGSHQISNDIKAIDSNLSMTNILLLGLIIVILINTFVTWKAGKKS